MVSLLQKIRSGIIGDLLCKVGKHKQVVIAEILSGLTVALALIPESVAFAFVAGVSPILSLQTAVMSLGHLTRR